MKYYDQMTRSELKGELVKLDQLIKESDGAELYVSSKRDVEGELRRRARLVNTNHPGSPCRCGCGCASPSRGETGLCSACNVGCCGAW